ncbi:MAG: hypothetical protein ACOC1F_05165 [Myxococcota bacterium]
MPTPTAKAKSVLREPSVTSGSTDRANHKPNVSGTTTREAMLAYALFVSP